jgi:lipid II:glycine glycyltransferase (peptidoglycan interpeptide bridge formation enzyme)
VNVREIRNASEWNAALEKIPNAHILQTWEWGALKEKYGWTASRIIFADNNSPVAAAQILRRSVPRTPFSVLYVPKGPALDYNNVPLFNRVLTELEHYARRVRAIFIKVDPDVLSESPAAFLLPKRRWRLSGEQIQYHNTVTLDLTHAEDELLAAMKPKWRYNIRLAQKKGVRVECGTEDDLALFYEMYAETSARDGFLIRQFPYYRDVWSTLMRAGLAQIFLAQVSRPSTSSSLRADSAQDETIAGLILFVFAGRAWYFYGASRNSHRELMPNHLLQWEAIRWAQQQGCREYDFWGAPDQLDESEPMFGVYKFKMGFGGKFVERIPAHDFVVNPTLYWLYAVARPWYLARLRKRHKVVME